MNDNIFIRYFNGEMDIFKYFNPNKNSMLSMMSGDELLDFLYYLDRCYLDLRNCLGLDNSITFGLELEFEYVADFNKCKWEFDNRFNFDKDRHRLDRWIFKEDITLHNDGAEVASPILRDSESTWSFLEDVCDFVSLRARIGKNCASQVHIGAHVLGNDVRAWINFIELWSVYENVIFRFLYGSYLSARGYVSVYSKPMSNILWKDYLHLVKNDDITLRDVLNRIKNLRKKRYALNFDNVKNFDEIKWKNTIEFRSPNGTLDPVIWQNNVNFLVKLLEYAKNDKFDHGIVLDRREKNFDIYSELIFYDEIYLEQALELCDLIFDNNLDKIYFMRQYLKSFEIGNQAMVETKGFTRKMIRK